MGHRIITTNMPFTLQINLLLSILTTDSFIVFSGCFCIGQLKFLPSSVCGIRKIFVLKLHLLARGVGTKRMDKLTWPEEGLAPQRHRLRVSDKDGAAGEGVRPWPR